MITCMLTIFKLFFPELTKESCKPYPLPLSWENQRPKTLWQKPIKVRLWLVVSPAKKQITVPSHLFASSCSGFSPLAITQDSHLGTNRVGRGGFCGAEGREEEGCLAGLRTGTSIKVSILCQLKLNCSATAPKNRAETAKNKAAERRAPPTSRWDQSLGYSLKKANRVGHAALEVRNSPGLLLFIWDPRCTL